MYGLVNQAIEQMVLSQHSATVWQTIKQKAGIDVPFFVNMHSYPDHVTYDLVKAGGEVLNLAPEQILEAFGEYWVLFTAEKGYGDMLAMAGDTLPIFLQNLDMLHNVVGNIMPNLATPMFSCTDIGPTSLVLHYHSHRLGLAPMVIGLVKGLGKRFATPCQVNQLTSKEKGSNNDSFLVNW
jgi:hypothetical protein